MLWSRAHLCDKLADLASTERFSSSSGLWFSGSLHCCFYLLFLVIPDLSFFFFLESKFWVRLFFLYSVQKIFVVATFLMCFRSLVVCLLCFLMVLHPVSLDSVHTVAHGSCGHLGLGGHSSFGLSWT